MKVLLLPICIVACVAVCFGQSNKTVRPDLTGTWEFEYGRSIVAKSKGSAREQIKITQDEPELIIRRRVNINGEPQERDLTYYTDGRGETNPTMDWLTITRGSDSFKPSEVESTTSWQKNKIVTRSITRIYAGAARIECEIIDELKLSSDGKKLTLTRRYVPPRDVRLNFAFVAGRGTEVTSVYKLISK